MSARQQRSSTPAGGISGGSGRDPRKGGWGYPQPRGGGSGGPKKTGLEKNSHRTRTPSAGLEGVRRTQKSPNMLPPSLRSAPLPVSDQKRSLGEHVRTNRQEATNSGEGTGGGELEPIFRGRETGPLPNKPSPSLPSDKKNPRGGVGPPPPPPPTRVSHASEGFPLGPVGRGPGLGADAAAEAGGAGPAGSVEPLALREEPQAVRPGADAGEKGSWGMGLGIRGGGLTWEGRDLCNTLQMKQLPYSPYNCGFWGLVADRRGMRADLDPMGDCCGFC